MVGGGDLLSTGFRAPRFSTFSAGEDPRLAKQGDSDGVVSNSMALIMSRQRASIAALPFNGLDPETVQRIRRGAYVRSEEWGALFSEHRLRTRAHAVARSCQTPAAAFSGATAAALWGLPLYRVPDARVEMAVPSRTTRRNGADIVRRQLPLPEQDVECIDGLRVTTLERTIYDVIRSLRVEAALVCFDAALRSVAWDDEARDYDLAAAAQFRQGIERRIRNNPGARGIRQARFAVAFADGRAQLPGESVSRLWMHQLGLPAPRLQHRVDLPGGARAFVDFAWPECGAWGEFDGVVKYSDSTMLAGRTPEQVIEDQAQRSRLIASVTGWSEVRWGFQQMPDLSSFAAHLRAEGLLRSLSRHPS